MSEYDEAAVRERVSSARLRVMARLPFFGHLLAKVEVEVTEGIQIAAITPGRKILVNPHWVISTTMPELAATLVHETLHAALLVWERQGSRDVRVGGMSLWNVAHDYVINLLIRVMKEDELLDPGLWEPKGLIDHRFDGMAAEEVYTVLLKELSQSPKPSPKGGGSKGGGGKKKPGQGGGGQQQQQGQQQGPAWVKDVHTSHDDVKGKGSQSQDAAEKAAETEFWKVALVEAAQVQEQRKGKGSLPGTLQNVINELLDPRVPWGEVLSRWVGANGHRSDFSYSRPSRRSESCGEILPSMVKHGCADVVVLWDTSGSMNGREVTIMSEVIGIADELGLSLRVVCCDTQITADVDDVQEPEDVPWAGGGGSDFRPAFERLREEMFDGVVIAFTDGWIDVPREKPVDLKGCLWVIWEGDADPTGGRWGEVLFVDQKGYAK